MSKKHLFISLFLTVCIAIAMCVSLLADSDLDAQLAAAEARLAEIQKQQADLEADTKKLKSEQKSLLSQKQSLELEIDALDAEISVQNDLIATLNLRVQQTTKELEQAQLTYDEYYEAYKARIRANYEAGDVFYLEILFGAENFADLLTRIDYVTQIAAYDNMVMEKMNTAITTIDAAKAQIEADLAAAEQLAADLEHSQNLQKAKTSEIDKMVDGVKAEIAENSEKMEEFDRLEAAEHETIYQIQQELQRKLDTSEDFRWPLDPIKYGRKSITSYYLEYRNFDKSAHRALDIGAPKGTEIYASNRGEIIMYKYVTTGGGNKVVIDHGDGISTQYCHLSAFRKDLKVGDMVEKGEVIGYVGMTGTATGNHLHFVVTIDGKAVNPLLYITPDDTAEKSLLDVVK